MRSAYVDLAALPEDERITEMGNAARRNPATKFVAIVDSQEVAERYQQKLKQRFGGIRVQILGQHPSGAFLVSIQGPVQ